MKFGGKEFSEYWKIIKMPLFVLIAWGVLAFIVAAVSFSTYLSIFSGVAGWILNIAVFGFIGWHVIKDHKADVKTAAWGGALTGVIAGFVGAVLGLIMYYAVPSFGQFMLSQATAGGAPAEAVQGFLAIGLYIGLVTGPIVSGIIGAIISAIAGLIAKKV